METAHPAPQFRLTPCRGVPHTPRGIILHTPTPPPTLPTTVEQERFSRPRPLKPPDLLSVSGDGFPKAPRPRKAEQAWHNNNRGGQKPATIVHPN